MCGLGGVDRLLCSEGASCGLSLHLRDPGCIACGLGLRHAVLMQRSPARCAGHGYRGGGLWSCYQHTGQHGAIARDYYRTQTVPANPADPDMAALLREYDQLGAASDRIQLRVLKRAPAWSARHV